jgi:hypothetical protein
LPRQNAHSRFGKYVACRFELRQMRVENFNRILKAENVLLCFDAVEQFVVGGRFFIPVRTVEAL